MHALKHKTSGVRLIELPASALSRTSKLYIFWRTIGEQKWAAFFLFHWFLRKSVLKLEKRKYIDCPSCSLRIISRRKSRQRKLGKKKNGSVNELCLCVPKATFIFISPFPWRLLVLNWNCVEPYSWTYLRPSIRSTTQSCNESCHLLGWLLTQLNGFSLILMDECNVHLAVRNCLICYLLRMACLRAAFWALCYFLFI